MAGHYPSDEILKIIRNFDITKKPIKDLLELMKNEWEFSESGGFDIRKKEKVYVQANSFGWSGNEDLIDAFQKVKWIGMFWKKSERGGHYWYEFPTYAYDSGIAPLGTKEAKKMDFEKFDAQLKKDDDLLKIEIPYRLIRFYGFAEGDNVRLMIKKL